MAKLYPDNSGLISYKEIDKDYLIEEGSKYQDLITKTDNELIELYRDGKKSNNDEKRRKGNAALNFLIARNKKVINGHVKKMLAKYPDDLNIDIGDLYQAGRVGLLMALDKFDMSRGTKFTTYASDYMFNAIREEINASLHNIHISENIQKIIRDIAQYKKEYPDLSSYELTRSLIADGIVDSEKTYKKAEYYKALSDTLPMYQPAVSDSDSENEVCIEIRDNQTESPEDYVIRMDIESMISCVLTSLPEEQRTVIEMLNGFTDGKIYCVSEVAKELGISAAKVSSIRSEVQAILEKKLKELRK